MSDPYLENIYRCVKGLKFAARGFYASPSKQDQNIAVGLLMASKALDRALAGQDAAGNLVMEAEWDD